MQAVRLRGDKGYDPMPGPHAEFVVRVGFLEELFSAKRGRRIANGRTVRSLVRGSIGFDWFDRPYIGFMDERGPPNEDHFWLPEGILEALEAIREVLRERRDALPAYYGLYLSSGKRMEGAVVTFIEGRPHWVKVGWHRCVALPDDPGQPLPPDSRGVDLRGVREIQAHESFMPLDLRRLNDLVLGPALGLRIERETLLARFGGALDGMTDVCRTAQGIGRVFTWVL